MPTLLRWRGFRFFFYMADLKEPAHVHVYKDGREAKVWLHDCSVAFNYGHDARDLGLIVGQVREHRGAFMEVWNAHARN